MYKLHHKRQKAELIGPSHGPREGLWIGPSHMAPGKVYGSGPLTWPQGRFMDRAFTWLKGRFMDRALSHGPREGLWIGPSHGPRKGLWIGPSHGAREGLWMSELKKFIFKIHEKKRRNEKIKLKMAKFDQNLMFPTFSIHTYLTSVFQPCNNLI